MTKTMREEIKPPKYLGEAIAKLPEIIELKRKLAVLADDFYMNHSFDTDWLDAYVEAIYLDCFKPLFDSQLQSVFEEIEKEVIGEDDVVTVYFRRYNQFPPTEHVEDCIDNCLGALAKNQLRKYQRSKLSTLKDKLKIKQNK